MGEIKQALTKPLSAAINHKLAKNKGQSKNTVTSDSFPCSTTLTDL